MTVQSLLFLLIQKFTVASDPFKLLQTNLYCILLNCRIAATMHLSITFGHFVQWKNENKNAYTA